MTDAGTPFCFHCKKPLSSSDSSTLRIQYRDTCPQCGSDLHVCRNCEFYDEGSHHECRESSAEWVRNKEKGNVCEYFRIAAGAKNSERSTSATLAALNELFKK